MMGLNFRILLLHAVLLSHYADADYLCYSCASHNGDSCNKIDEHTPVINCTNGCTKIRTQPLIGSPRYTRGCSASRHFQGCESINIIGNMKKECDCRRDFCNHGNRRISETTVSVLATVLCISVQILDL